jgi:protein SCO1/2
MTLHRLGFLRQKIGPEFDRIKIVFVSLDPKRDTPEVLKNYMEGQPVRVTGLTGTEADIAKMAKRFDVFHEVIRVPGQDYTIDHTASIFLVDKKGRRSGEITMDADESEYEKKLRQLLQGSTNFDPKNQIS